MLVMASKALVLAVVAAGRGGGAIGGGAAVGRGRVGVLAAVPVRVLVGVLVPVGVLVGLLVPVGVLATGSMLS